MSEYEKKLLAVAAAGIGGIVLIYALHTAVSEVRWAKVRSQMLEKAAAFDAAVVRMNMGDIQDMTDPYSMLKEDERSTADAG